MKTYVVGTDHLTEALLMSTHNICFQGEIKNTNTCGVKSVLSGSMLSGFCIQEPTTTKKISFC